MNDTDRYFLFYEMMMTTLKKQNVVDGITKSLHLLEVFLKSDFNLLYKKNEKGIYDIFNVDSSKNNDERVNDITNIVNKVFFLVEKKEIYNLEMNFSKNLRNIGFIHVKTTDNDYILTINNYNNDVILPMDFWEQLKDTITVILNRADSYERNTKAITTDLLTGLDNRNSYEMRLNNLKENDDMLIYVLFDIFRLKYINDNFSHATGDEYIKKVANVLKKYWPKSNYDNEKGHCIYRIGGDEFVLLTNKDDFELTLLKANLVAEEVELINLNIGDDLPLGVNYGIVLHTPQDLYLDTYKEADRLLGESKRKMYKRYNIERRR